MKLCKWKCHVRLIALAAVLVAVAGVVFAPDPIHAQGGDNDYVDVGLTLEVPYNSSAIHSHDLNTIVVNNGSRTAYDVEVVLEIKYPDESVYRLPEVPVGSASLENNGRSLRWSIPALEGLQRVEVEVDAVHLDDDGLPPADYDNALIQHEHFGRVTTSSFEGDHHKGNNTSRVWGFMTNDRNKHYYQVVGNYTLNVSVDKPSPSQEDTINFTITTGRERVPGTLPDNIVFPHAAPPIDLKVDIELTDGLTVKGNPTFASSNEGGLTKPVPASVNYSDGVFSIGTLKLEEPVVNAVTLPVTVASSAVVNGQCLTATLTGNPPPGTGRYDDDISDKVAKVCLGIPSQKKAYQNGTVGSPTIHVCRTDVPAGECDTADEVNIQFATATDDPSKQEMHPAVIHIKDQPGRLFDAHSGSVTDGTTVS